MEKIQITDEDKRFMQRAMTERATRLDELAEEAKGQGAAESFRRGANRLRELADAIDSVAPVLLLGTGAAEIAEERQRQIEKEGWTPEHDDKHVGHDLAWAAAAYAAPGPVVHRGNGQDIWPWDLAADKRNHHDRIKRLRIAGALCAAEIDRLNRQAERFRAAAFVSSFPLPDAT